MPPQITPSRQLASYFLIGAIGIFALNHWYYVDTGGYYPIVVYGAPLFGFLALGSLVNPQLLLALEGRDYPTHLRVLAILLAVAGVACGFVLHKNLYGL
jgi:hypothetical protein